MHCQDASSLLLDEAPSPLNAHRGEYAVSIATQPAAVETRQCLGCRGVNPAPR